MSATTSCWDSSGRGVSNFFSRRQLGQLLGLLCQESEELAPLKCDTSSGPWKRTPPRWLRRIPSGSSVDRLAGCELDTTEADCIRSGLNMKTRKTPRVTARSLQPLEGNSDLVASCCLLLLLIAQKEF